MRITFTEKIMSNGVMIITAWDGTQWCSVSGLIPEKQTLENISKIKRRMAERARLPGAPRNGKRSAIKC
ncbi:hypothetical protein K18_061 [Salmonella phage Kenya-K18]|nr:hypothetical protein K18_061 [Salmonella phage Kenya-K18]